MYENQGVERGVMKDHKSTQFSRTTRMYTMIKATVICRRNPMNNILNQNPSTVSTANQEAPAKQHISHCYHGKVSLKQVYNSRSHETSHMNKDGN